MATRRKKPPASPAASSAARRSAKKFSRKKITLPRRPSRKLSVFSKKVMAVIRARSAQLDSAEERGFFNDTNIETQRYVLDYFRRRTQGGHCRNQKDLAKLVKDLKHDSDIDKEGLQEAQGTRSRNWKRKHVKVERARGEALLGCLRVIYARKLVEEIRSQVAPGRPAQRSLAQPRTLAA